jgi:hypothetical protein
MSEHTKYLRRLIIKAALSVLTIPASFFIMYLFDLNMHDKFISALDGSTGPAFTTFSIIAIVLLSAVWFNRIIVKIIKAIALKFNKQN